MKISYILDTFGGGGKERRCLQLIQGLNKQGYSEIQVIIINDDVAYSEIYDTSAQIYILDWKNKGLSFLQTCKSVKTLFEDFKPDIVQTWGGISTLIPILLKPFFNFKLIGAYVADANKIGRWSLNACYPYFCDKVIGNSQIGLNAYRVPEKKGLVIYNGFNEKRLESIIDRNIKKSELAISTPFIIAMLARFDTYKDWACFLNAAKQVVKYREDITFLGVGNGPMWEEMNQKINEEERKHIKLIGRRDDIDELLQICNLTVLTSKHEEGVSNSILESMAWGVPAIATNSGGTPEIISDGRNGVLLNKNDSELLSDIIIKLLDDSQKLSDFSRNASKTVQEKFLLERMTEQYLNLYKSFKC